jgi:hypothetical protein
MNSERKGRCVMNAINIPRRLLLGSAVGAFALRPSRTAQADTTFTNFSFAATGAATARTMPDRLSDVQNVKDWGAVGNNSNNDTTAINNAIAYCVSQGGGTVFFPPGIYLLKRGTGHLTVGSSSDVGVQLIGSGKDCTWILGGNTSGYVISRDGQTFDNIARIEAMLVGNGTGTTASTGAIQVTRNSVGLRDLRFGGFIGIDASSAAGCSISDCFFNGNSVLTANNSTTGTTPGTIGIVLGSGGTARNCRTTGAFEIAFAMSGSGATLLDCSAENNTTGVRVGWSLAGETAATGCSVVSFQTEACMVPIDLYNATGCFISGNVVEGAKGTPHLAAISRMIWNSGSGGFVTVTTASAHNLGANGTTHKLQIFDPSPSALVPAPAGLIFATVTSSTQFTYPLANNPGSFSSAGGWTHPQQYSLRCRKVYETVIAGNNCSQHEATIASVDLDYSGAAEHRNNLLISYNGVKGWKVPSNSKNLAGWRFINCTGSVGPYGDNLASPFGQMHFSDLPGQSGVPQDGPYESQEYDIIDSPTAASGNFAANVTTGGGSNHVRLRYNGTNWKIIG